MLAAVETDDSLVGRFSPRGPRGISTPLLLGGKHTHSDANTLGDESTYGRMSAMKRSWFLPGLLMAMSLAVVPVRR